MRALAISSTTPREGPMDAIPHQYAREALLFTSCLVRSSHLPLFLVFSHLPHRQHLNLKTPHRGRSLKFRSVRGLFLCCTSKSYDLLHGNCLRGKVGFASGKGHSMEHPGTTTKIPCDAVLSQLSEESDGSTFVRDGFYVPVTLKLQSTDSE